MIPNNVILNGDALTMLKTLPDNYIDCCVTSPPYWGLRDYGVEGQLGLEKTPEEFVSKIVEVFREVKQVLKPEGTLWLNLGDSYAGSGKGIGSDHGKAVFTDDNIVKTDWKQAGLKPKDLVGIPWMVAFALRADGWYLRQDIIWHKPNPMPESVTDRCTKSHEYIFLMSKSSNYYYDHEAIKTGISDATIKRLMQNIEYQKGSDRVPGKTNGTMKAVGELRKGYSHRGPRDKKLSGHTGNLDINGNVIGGGMANKRSVWTVNTMPYKEAHFATFPEEIPETCIKAGCPENGIVLDPFMGAGTTAMVARKLNRNFIGIELNTAYIKIANKRLYKEIGMYL